MGRTAMVGTALLLGLLVGCQGEQACTLIGAPSTISMDVSRVLADQEGPVSVRLCVEETCATTRKPDGRRLDAVYVDDPNIDNEGPVGVDVFIETRSGERIFEAGTDVTLTFLQPNGPDCEPSKFSRGMVASEQGGGAQLLPA